MNLIILKPARHDLDEGFHFYERQRSGAGEYFLSSIFEDVDSLRNLAGIHPVVYGAFRMVATKFPYAIYYEINGGTVEIQAILDGRRDPMWIQKKLTGHE